MTKYVRQIYFFIYLYTPKKKKKRGELLVKDAHSYLHPFVTNVCGLINPPCPFSRSMHTVIQFQGQHNLRDSR